MTADTTTLSPDAYKALEAKNTTEEQFRRALRKTAHDYGYSLAYHTKYSIGSDPGFPDEVYIRPGPPARCVIFEAKRVGKGPTERQVAWLEAWNLIPGVEAYCVTPANWDFIHAVLGRGWMQEMGDE